MFIISDVVFNIYPCLTTSLNKTYLDDMMNIDIMLIIDIMGLPFCHGIVPP